MRLMLQPFAVARQSLSERLFYFPHDREGHHLENQMLETFMN